MCFSSPLKSPTAQIPLLQQKGSVCNYNRLYFKPCLLQSGACGEVFQKKGPNQEVKKLTCQTNCGKVLRKAMPHCSECFAKHLIACLEDPCRFPSCVWCAKIIGELHIKEVIKQKVIKQSPERYEEFSATSERLRLGREGNATLKCTSCAHLHH